MRCLHPYCPAGAGLPDWTAVMAQPEIALSPSVRAAAGTVLAADFAEAPTQVPVTRNPPPMPMAAFKRLLLLCPCLYNQIDIAASARAIIHFCELTLGTAISSANVHDAFLIQHPSKGPPFNPGPARACGAGGTVMEMLCSEVLVSAGIPAMRLAADKWPLWQMPGHVLLNQGKMSSLQALGDVLIPCAPTNLVISVKSEVARERLLYSANSIEGVGFGFFREPEEFWTGSRMALYKRMGFTAIYMPDETHKAVVDHIGNSGTARHSININGTDLYRPLSGFGDDMRRVVGRSSALL